MIKKISGINFEITSSIDDFGEGVFITFCPIGGNNLVNKHSNYFKFSAQVNQKTGSIKFIGIDVETYHYANGWFKTNSSKSDYLLWFSFIMRDFKDYFFLQTEYSKIQFSKGSNILFLFKNNSIINMKSEYDPTESFLFGKVKLSCYPYNLSQEEITILKNERFLKWRFNNDTSSFEGGRTLAHPFGIEENILIAANIYDYLVTQYFPEHKRINFKEEKKENITKDSCSLYLMKDQTNGFYKIGISNNPEYREHTLQSEKPTIELVVSKEFSSRNIAIAIESAIHKAFHSQRLRGEWFDLKSNHLIEILELFK